METKSLSPVITQIVERKLGMFCSSAFGNDLYYLLEAMNTLISAVGENEVKIEWEKSGKNWDKFILKLNNLNKLSTKVKIYYDALQNKKLDKKPENEVQKYIRTYFIRCASKIAVMQRDIFDMFLFLVNITTIKNKTITSDAFKILEHSGTGKFDHTKRPMPYREKEFKE